MNRTIVLFGLCSSLWFAAAFPGQDLSRFNLSTNDGVNELREYTFSSNGDFAGNTTLENFTAARN